MNAEAFNGLMQQVSRLTLRQRALLRKRLDEVDGQAQGRGLGSNGTQNPVKAVFVALDKQFSTGETCTNHPLCNGGLFIACKGLSRCKNVLR